MKIEVPEKQCLMVTVKYLSLPKSSSGCQKIVARWVQGRGGGGYRASGDSFDLPRKIEGDSACGVGWEWQSLDKVLGRGW